MINSGLTLGLTHEVKLTVYIKQKKSDSFFRELSDFVWAKMDSNHRRRKPADLQSAPFGHSGICPFAFKTLSTFG